MIISRILIPVDFSDPSLQALEYAIELGRRSKILLFVTYVIDPVAFTPPASEFGPVADMSVVFDELQRAGSEQLKHLAADLAKRRIPVRTLLQFGNPAQVIVATAKRLHADLIVMSTHGRSGFSHLFLGSVAERVVRTAACPVLTVRADQRRGRRSPSRARRPVRRRHR